MHTFIGKGLFIPSEAVLDIILTHTIFFSVAQYKFHQHILPYLRIS